MNENGRREKAVTDLVRLAIAFGVGFTTFGIMSLFGEFVGGQSRGEAVARALLLGIGAFGGGWFTSLIVDHSRGIA